MSTRPTSTAWRSIHGLVPDAQLAAAQAFQILGERSLDYPYVGKLG